MLKYDKLRIYDTVNKTELSFTSKQASVLADEINAEYGNNSLYWNDEPLLLIDLGESRELHGLVFEDGTNDYALKAIFALTEPPPTVFWMDYFDSHPDSKARPVKDFTEEFTDYIPAVNFRPYSRTCPPPPSPPPFKASGSSPGSSSGQDGCTLVKVAQWVGAHGVSVTTTTPVAHAEDPPASPGPGAADDPPWHLRNAYVDCI